MKLSNNLILPIRLETLRHTLGNSMPLSGVENPYETFKETIRNFEKFAAGRFFWFVVDLMNWKHILGGGDIEKMTTLKAVDFNEGDPQKLHNITHPEDLPKVLAFTNFWVNYSTQLPADRIEHLKMSLYFRLLNAEQNYSWIMVQYPNYISDSNNNFVFGLVVVTDISHIKKEGRPMMSILDTHDDNFQQFFCLDDNNLTCPEYELPKLTTRELEIFHYLVIGYKSKQIALQLNISVKTIDNHRQNMLHKTHSKSTAELVNYCIRMGYA